MKKLLIGANCQGYPLSIFLKKNISFNNEFDVIVKKNFLEFKDQTEELDKIFKEIDVYIYQPIKEENFYYNIKFLKEKLLKKDCILISFPVLYFTGYWTDYNKNNGLCNHILPYYNNKIEELIRKYGKNNLDKITKEAKDVNLFSKEEVLNNLNISIKELERRESENNIDIKASHFIMSNYNEFRLFNTVNHPSNKMMWFISNNILTKLGFSDPYPYEVGSESELLGNYQLPIFPSVIKHLGLKFINTNEPINICIGPFTDEGRPTTKSQCDFNGYIKWFIEVFGDKL